MPKKKKKSEAQRSEERRRSLAAPNSGSKFLFTPSENATGVVHTASRFHSPVSIVGKAIREVLDPVRAPKTLCVWTSDAVPAENEREPTGPQTENALQKINARHERLRVLRRAARRAKERRDNPMGYAARGLTSCFSDTRKESRAERDQRIEKFLRSWLHNEPQEINSIRKDARRDELPWSAVRRVARSMGVVVQRRTVPHGKPVNVWALPENTALRGGE